MKIELLYFEGCPSYQTALCNLQEVLDEEKADVPVDMVRIESPEQALRNKFLGSPTIRINGQDIEPGVRALQDFSMRCRLYSEAGRITGWPSKDLLRRALKEAREKRGGNIDGAKV